MISTYLSFFVALLLPLYACKNDDPVAPPVSSSGNAIALDGNGDYVKVPYSLGYRSTDAITVETWFRLYFKISRNKGFRLISITQAGGGALYFNNGDNDNRLGFVANVNGQYYYAALDSNRTFALVPFTWYHVAGVYDGSRLIFYLNGEEVNAVSIQGNLNYSANNALFIGAEADEGDFPTDSFYFLGEIDETRIWQTARSITEIRETMRRELTGREANLIAYWSFNEPAGVDTTADLCRNGLDGSLAGEADFVASGLSKARW